MLMQHNAACHTRHPLARSRRNTDARQADSSCKGWIFRRQKGFPNSLIWDSSLCGLLLLESAVAQSMDQSWTGRQKWPLVASELSFSAILRSWRRVWTPPSAGSQGSGGSRRSRLSRGSSGSRRRRGLQGSLGWRPGPRGKGGGVEEQRRAHVHEATTRRDAMWTYMYIL